MCENSLTKRRKKSNSQIYKEIRLLQIGLNNDQLVLEALRDNKSVSQQTGLFRDKEVSTMNVYEPRLSGSISHGLCRGDM